MSRSRREFLTLSTLGFLSAAISRGAAQSGTNTTTTTPGAPPAFGTAPPAGPEVAASDFVAAQKLVNFPMTTGEYEQAASNWRISMAPYYERRVGPKKVAVPESVVPATQWNPAGIPDALSDLEGHSVIFKQLGHIPADSGPLPQDDASIAYSPVWRLSGWIKRRQLTSERLTKIYIERLKRFDPQLRCVITLCEEHALEQARQADREIAAGNYRGPLHGIPWGAKDLLDTKGIPTTYGAEPFRNRVPEKDAVVVKRLNEAGAVLVAKLSLGALALNDIWFGGQTMNPWLLEEGSSGSSAGPGAAVAAGLVGFAIGSETDGSIISPSMRCGVTGLRPTFGRVPRTGAMTLCWSLDKLGPMARSVEDTMLVLEAIAAPDEGDLATWRRFPAVPPTPVSSAEPNHGKRIGYFPGWMKEAPATDVDRKVMEKLRELGYKLVEVKLPDWPYDSLDLILFAEAAAAFEELTLSGGLNELRSQAPDAWPNSFRQARFLSAVDFVQTDRFRRMVAMEMARLLGAKGECDLLLVPSLRDEMMQIANFTGHPSLTLRAGFVEVSEARSDWAPDPARPLPKFDPPRRVPHGVTLIGPLFGEARMGMVGMELEQALKVADKRPPGF
jgi:Asp-tRNA(Asn)/Glu-tRNA(Gln) amidotransferase A subunit family amidase